MADAMDKKLAISTLSWCDQIEQALKENDWEIVELVRAKLIAHFTQAKEVDIRVAIECARARAQEVLNEQE